jgi:hypothetical protein
MSIAARLTNNGNLLVNGSFDEVTSISPAKFRITGNTSYAGTFNEVTDMIVTNGLLLYVNGSSDVYSGSGTTWSDLSTYNNNATLTNSPTYNVGTGGGSFAFNGSTQYAPVTAALLNTTYTGKTVFFVGRLNSAAWTPGVGQFRAMFGSAGSPRNFNFYVYHDTGNSIYFHYSTTGSSFITNSVSLNTNTWFVAAVTQDATTTKVYLNGTEVYSVSGQTLSQYANGGEEAVGKADNYWYGDIAVCALYSRGLSAAEILNNYNAFAARVGLTPTGTAPVGRASSDNTMYVTGIFDEFTGATIVDSSLKLWLDAGQTASYSGSGSTWTDLSSTGNNGTLVNSPTYSSTNGGSLEFNGTNNYITFPVDNRPTISTTTGFTIGMWVFQAATQASAFWNYFYNNGSLEIGSYGTNGTSFLMKDYGAPSTPTVSTGNIVTGWNYIAFGTDSSRIPFMYHYNATTSSYGTASAFNPVTYTIDKLLQGGSTYYGAKFGLIQIYDRVLSTDEVATNFNALRGRYGI